MRILHRYIAQNLISTFLTSLFVLSFVMMVGLLFKATRYIASGASFMSVVQFIGFGFPGTLSMSIPISALVSTMLVFGRLSADSEISAMRACGVSMRRIMLTPFLLGIALSAICFHITGSVAPESSYARRTFRNIIKTSDVLAVIQPGKSIAGLPGLGPDTSVFVGTRTNEWLYNVRIQEPLKNGGGIRDIKAESAHVMQQTNGTVRLEMYKVVMSPLAENRPGVGQAESINYILGDDYSSTTELPPRRIKDMPSRELDAERRERLDHILGLEERIAETAPEVVAQTLALDSATAQLESFRATGSVAGSPTDATTDSVAPSLPAIPLAGMESGTNVLAILELRVADIRDRVEELQIRQEKDGEELKQEVVTLSCIRTESTNRIVLALASLCFIAVAVPYGLKGQRRESSVGTIVCLCVCAVYYLFLVMTESLAKHPEYHPHIIAWCPVVLCAFLSIRGIQRNT